MVHFLSLFNYACKCCGVILPLVQCDIFLCFIYIVIILPIIILEQRKYQTIREN